MSDSNLWNACKKLCQDVVRQNTLNCHGYQVEEIVNNKIAELQPPHYVNGIRHRYEDIILRPRFSPYRSRKDAQTKIELGLFRFRLPVVPANMKAVINDDLAHWMASEGYFYILHRFGDTEKFARELDYN